MNIKHFLLVILFIQASVTASQPIHHLSGLNDSHYQLLHSAILDHDYHIYVRVPPGTKSEDKLPTVYLLDGGNTFPMLAPYAKYLELLEETPPIMLVGIAYGTDDWRQGNRRNTDYTLPAAEPDYYGGAAPFHRFLTEELMPWVETNHPSDPNNRILFGQSLGGQFALYCAMFQPDTFAGLIASNPAIHRNTDAFTTAISGDFQATEASPRLFIMQADGDEARFQQARDVWLNHWQGKDHHWQTQVMTAIGHNHMSSVPAAYRQGMLWLLNDNNHNDSK
jgi:predicted alpha/beta superfamily hydrolase